MLTLVLATLVTADVDAEILNEAAELPPIERAAFEKAVRKLPKPKRQKLTPDELIALARMKRALMSTNRERLEQELQDRLGPDVDLKAWLKKRPAERKALEKKFALDAAQKEQLKDEEARVLLEKNKPIDDERREKLIALLKRFRGHTGKVHGPDDRDEFPPRGTATPTHVDAIGALKGLDCTCSHIGDKLVVTAAHCLKREPFAEFGTACPGNTSIDWGRLGDGKPSATSKCVKVVAAELSDTRDYALIRVDKAPPAQLAFRRAPKPVPGDSVVVLGYPSGRNLSTSKPCALVAPSVADSAFVGHPCDTSAGNSGGPVLDATTFALVAIHNGGYSGEAQPDGGFDALNWATILDTAKLNQFLPDAGAP